MHGTRRPIARADADTSDAALRALVDKVNDEFAVADQAWLAITPHAIACGTHLNELKARVVKRFGYGHWQEQRNRYFPKRKRRTLEQYAQVADWYKKLAPAEAQRVAHLPYRQVLQLLPGRKPVEHYTPPNIVEAVRRVFGGTIDLDPASCERANRVVKATRFFTREQDGLSQPWLADNVWLNSPFCGEVAAWVAKLLQEYHSGNVTAAILLLNVTGYSTNTKWFRPLSDYLVCRPRERLKFYGPDVDADPVPVVLVYLGPDGVAFWREFKRFGPVSGQLESFIKAGLALPTDAAVTT